MQNRRSFTITIIIKIIFAWTFVVFIGRSRYTGVFNQLLLVSSTTRWGKLKMTRSPRSHRQNSRRTHVRICIYTCKHVYWLRLIVFVIWPRFNFPGFSVRSANRNVYMRKRSNIGQTLKCERAWGYWILWAKRRLIETADQTATNARLGPPGEEETIFVLHTIQVT